MPTSEPQSSTLKTKHRNSNGAEKYLSFHFMVFYLLLSHPDFKCFLRHCFYCLSYLITSNPRTIEKSHYIYCLQTCCKTPYCNNVTDIAQSSAVVNLINILLHTFIPAIYCNFQKVVPYLFHLTFLHLLSSKIWT